MKNATLDKIRS